MVAGHGKSELLTIPYPELRSAYSVAPSAASAPKVAWSAADLLSRISDCRVSRQDRELG